MPTGPETYSRRPVRHGEPITSLSARNSTRRGALSAALATALANFDSDTTGGTDANILPGMLYDAVETTNGSDLVLSFHADGAGRAA